MRFLARIILTLFVVSLLGAALGQHCAVEMPMAHAGEHAHEHSDGDHHKSDAPDQKDVCASMELGAVLASTTLPKPTETVAPIIVAIVSAHLFSPTLTVDAGSVHPPPILPGGYGSAFARTGRLLI